MLRFTKKTALLFPLLCVPALAKDDIGIPSKVHETTLTAVRKNPDAFKNVWIRFDAQFSSQGRVFNPFFTIFTPTEFANFAVWGDEQNLWTKSEYDDAFGYLFVHKRADHAPEMLGLVTYDRIRCTAVVRNTFQGTPWIEVMKVEKLDKSINTETLAHLYRGSQLMEQRKWQLAVGELSLADVTTVPERVVGEAHKLVGVCHLRLGEPEPARSQLAKAAELLRNDRELSTLQAIAARNPELGLDRVVTTQPIKEFERPMWEAFERTAKANEPAARPPLR